MSLRDTDCFAGTPQAMNDLPTFVMSLTRRRKIQGRVEKFWPLFFGSCAAFLPAGLESSERPKFAILALERRARVGNFASLDAMLGGCAHRS